MKFLHAARMPAPAASTPPRQVGYNHPMQDADLPRTQESPTQPLDALAYHRLIAGHLERYEPEIWSWGRGHRLQHDQADETRAYLLRETYRLDAAAHPEVHEDCRLAQQTLGLDAPVALYQAQGGDGAMNAALLFVPGEINLLLQGPVLEKLSRPERIALIGHELAHYRLWTEEDGIFHTASAILDHALAYSDAAPSHIETARLYRLHTELYADRGAALSAGAAGPAIGALVKTMTGLTAADPEAYLRQAAEAEADLGASSPALSGAQTHPEVFLRAQAVDRWWRAEPGTDAWIEQRLRGRLSLAALDLPRQAEAAALTRQVLTRLAADPASDPETASALVRRYFPDWTPGEAAADDADLAPDRFDGDFRDYLVSISLDLALADPEGRDDMLAAAARLSLVYDGAEAFKAALKRDVKFTRAAIDKLFKPLQGQPA